MKTTNVKSTVPGIQPVANKLHYRSKEIKMKSLRKFVWVVAVSAFALSALSLSGYQASAAAAQATTSTVSTNYYYDFSVTTKPWLSAVNANSREVPPTLERVPNIDGCAPAHEGGGFAELKMSTALPTLNPPRKRPGAPLPILGTWMVIPLQVTGLNRISVEYAAANLAQCDACSPMVYVGTDAPAYASQFARDSQILSTKWQTFSYATTLASTKQIYVALGFDSVNAAVGFDCVNIKVDSLVQDSTQPGTK